MNYFFAFLAAALALPALGDEPMKSGRIEANGISYYYEIHGQGEPLLLLHGGLGSIGMFEPDLAALARERQVDRRGPARPWPHAARQPQDHPQRHRRRSRQGADRAWLSNRWTCWAIPSVAPSRFRLAIQHPDKVRRLVLVSAGFAQDGFYPEMLPMQAAVGAAMAEQMKGTPMYQSYAAVAPDPAEFPKLLDAMGEWMRRPYDWADDVRALKMPVMLVYGDSDMFRPEHIVEFYHLLGGGLKDAGWRREHMSQNRLAILPDVTHYEMAASPALVPTVLPFLNGKSGTKASVEPDD